MSETPDSRKLSEDHVDRLLGAFYQHEMPAALDQLPSSWPQLADADAAGEQPAVTISPAAVAASPRSSSAARRVAAVLISMSACVAIVALSNLGGTQDDAAGTLPVSSGETAGSKIIDPESRTTMEEVEGFEFDADPQDPVETPESTDEP